MTALNFMWLSQLGRIRRCAVYSGSMVGKNTSEMGAEMRTPKISVSHSLPQERYEIYVDDEYVGYLDYVNETEQVVLTHTVVHNQYAGHGYAAHLVKYVLDDIAKTGKEVVPLCSYVGYYIEQHPEYAAMATEVTR
jgi:hypothetical protein